MINVQGGLHGDYSEPKFNILATAFRESWNELNRMLMPHGQEGGIPIAKLADIFAELTGRAGDLDRFTGKENPVIFTSFPECLSCAKHVEVRKKSATEFQRITDKLRNVQNHIERKRPKTDWLHWIEDARSLAREGRDLNERKFGENPNAHAPYSV